VAASTPEAKVEAAPPASIAAEPAPAKQRMPAAETPVAPAAKPERTIQQGAADTVEPARSSALRAESAAGREGAPAAPPPPALAAPAPPQAEERAKEMADQQVLSAQTDAPASAAEANVSAQGRLAKAKPVERTAAIAGDSIESDPARWMERIIALRDAGRDEDADRELARLRARYPDMKVPPNALARSGTR
jgi:hypothetical protein